MTLAQATQAMLKAKLITLLEPITILLLQSMQRSVPITPGWRGMIGLDYFGHGGTRLKTGLAGYGKFKPPGPDVITTHIPDHDKAGQYFIVGGNDGDLADRFGFLTTIGDGPIIGKLKTLSIFLRSKQ